MPDVTAFKIENPKTVELLAVFDPWLGKMDYDSLHNKYVVINYPQPGHYMVMDTYELGEKLDFVMRGITIQTIQLKKR